MKAVILAGGKGTRLRPYTTVFPKPLMPVGGKPILEILIRQLRAQGFTEVTLTAGYLGELIMAFFGDGGKFGVRITYSKEEEPLGTAGGLGLIKAELREDFLMINGDVLSTLDYAGLLRSHSSGGALATISLKKRQIRMDFGVIELDEHTSQITGYAEKPVIEKLVSMGAYALSPAALEYVTPGQYLDFPDLIRRLLANGKTVKGHVYDGYWLDIGRPDDYEQANKDIEEIYVKLGIA